MDKILLEGRKNDVPQPNQVESIINLTGIKIDHSIISLHRNMVVYGIPYDQDIGVETKES